MQRQTPLERLMLLRIQLLLFSFVIKLLLYLLMLFVRLWELELLTILNKLKEVNGGEFINKKVQFARLDKLRSSFDPSQVVNDDILLGAKINTLFEQFLLGL